MDIAVCGALNLEMVDKKPYQLIGGAYYSAFSTARYIKNVNLIGCIGIDVDGSCLKALHDDALVKNVKLNLSCYNGKNFKHHIR